MGPPEPTPDAPVGDLPEEWLARIKGEFLPGERCLWAGRPVRLEAEGTPWRVWAAWIVAFAGVGSVGGLAAGGGQPKDTVEKTGLGILMLGLTGGVITVGMLVESLRDRAAERARRRRIVYALTDRRAIGWIPAGRRAVEVATIPARSIGATHRVEYDDGTGDVVFSGNVPGVTFAGFLGVSDVRRVEALAREVLVDPDFRGFDALNPYHED